MRALSTASILVLATTSLALATKVYRARQRIDQVGIELPLETFVLRGLAHLGVTRTHIDVSILISFLSPLPFHFCVNRRMRRFNRRLRFDFGRWCKKEYSLAA